MTDIELKKKEFRISFWEQFGIIPTEDDMRVI